MGWLILAALLAGLVRGFSGFGTAMVFLPIASQYLTPFESIASLGWENWDFLAPVCAGDTISAKVIIVEKRETSKRDRGVIKLLFEVYNQNQIMVQTGKNNLLVKR